MIKRPMIVKGMGCFPSPHGFMTMSMGSSRIRLVASKAAASDAATQEPFDYDIFTIGAGSGGVRGSRFAASYGAKVAVCELPFDYISSDAKGGVGGTCVLRGCVPKKVNEPVILKTSEA